MKNPKQKIKIIKSVFWNISLGIRRSGNNIYNKKDDKDEEAEGKSSRKKKS